MEPWLILNRDNPLTDDDSASEGELHMHPGERVTVIGPDGDELLVWVEDGRLRWEDGGGA